MRYETVKRNLVRAYDANAEVRDAIVDADWKRAERERFAAALVDAGAAALLEIGAGHGVSGRYFADQGLAVTCTDLSAALVERCRAKGLSAHVMDFAALEFPDGAFDAVFGMNCLLHVPGADLPAVLRSVRRVLRDGGLFYWGQYGGHDFEGVWEPDTYRPQRFFAFLTDDRIQRAAAEVFDIVDFRTVECGSPELLYQALVVRASAAG